MAAIILLFISIGVVREQKVSAGQDADDLLPITCAGAAVTLSLGALEILPILKSGFDFHTFLTLVAPFSVALTLGGFLIRLIGTHKPKPLEVTRL